MSTFLVGRRFGGWLLLALAVTVFFALSMAVKLGPWDAALEEGPIEHAQEVLLAASMLMFIGAAIFQRGAGRLASFGMVLLCCIFFLRELELPVTGPITAYLNGPTFRLHETAALALLAIPYLVMRWRLIPALWAYVRSWAVWPFVLSAGFLGLGALAEATMLHLPWPAIGMLMEETFELMAYVVLFAMSLSVTIAAYQQSCRTTTDNSRHHAPVARSGATRRH